MTTSKKTKLGKGGAPWYPPLGETLLTDCQPGLLLVLEPRQQCGDALSHDVGLHADLVGHGLGRVQEPTDGGAVGVKARQKVSRLLEAVELVEGESTDCVCVCVFVVCVVWAVCVCSVCVCVQCMCVHVCSVCVCSVCVCVCAVYVCVCAVCVCAVYVCVCVQCMCVQCTCMCSWITTIPLLWH